MATLEVFSNEPNAAVLRLPGRRFPSVLVQGDTLHALARQAADVLAALDAGSPDYETVLLAHGHELPFVR